MKKLALALLFLSSLCNAQSLVPGLVSNAPNGAYALGRADSQLEARNDGGQGHALISITQMRNPGSTAEEGAVSYQAYDENGAMKQIASISAVWANNASIANGYASLRLNVDTANQGSDIFMRGFGGRNGVVFYGPNDLTPAGFPGVQITRSSGFPSLAGVNDLALEGGYQPGGAKKAAIFLNAYGGGEVYFGGDPHFTVASGCPTSAPAGVTQCVRVIAPDGGYGYLPMYR